MDTVRLGRTGLRVSRLCLGTMNFGPQASEADAHRIMDRAHEHGINFFDTADVYGWKKGEGWTEQIVGRWFAQGFDQFVVDDLDDLLPGIQSPRDFRPHRALTHSCNERFDDAEMHIRFEQCQAHFAHRCVYICFGEFSSPSELVKDLVESVGKIFKHSQFGKKSTKDVTERFLLRRRAL